MCELTEEKFHVYEKYIREGAEEGKEVRMGREGEIGRASCRERV